MDDTPPVWPTEIAIRLGELIAKARGKRNMTAVKLAEETERVGVPIHRVAITRIEKGEQVVTVPELIALGVALDTDWTRWLIKAAEGISIKGERQRREQLRGMLANLRQQIAGLEANMDQARAMYLRDSMPEEMRETLDIDLNEYERMIGSLEGHQLTILRLLDELPPGA